jgi:type I restriction enzyme M protein
MAADTDTLAIVLIEMLEPYAGRVRDPACASGGVFVQSETFPQDRIGATRQTF